ncbi:MAG: cytochrome c oxidase subunit I [Acidimicrobiales bacterium]
MTDQLAFVAAGGESLKEPRRRPWYLQQHLGTAAVGWVGGYFLGHLFGNIIASNYVVPVNNGENDIAIVLGLVFAVLGWLLGIGALNYPLGKLVGREPLPEQLSDRGSLSGVVDVHLRALGQAPVAPEPRSYSRYFKYTLDHKVVGLQYIFGVLLFLFTGGLLAMAIRSQLLSPSNHLINPATYIALVGEHGTIMMMMASSLVIGPLGNFLVPLMIGSRRMAFPRIEAASFWIFVSGYLTIVAAIPLGGFPTGWTGYATLQTQSTGGMDAYLVGFAVIGTGMVLAGFNLAVTIINYRAPGMSWGRVPIFVWSILATVALMVLATPVLVSACYIGILDRTAQTAFFVNEHGGSSFLWENLFWFFGHPEVYIVAIPGFGIVAEMLPVFCRKPLFAYKVGAAGMLGVALLSFFVWQHHLFQSGINPNMRPLYMLTTELISIPTGFVFLVAMGTMWKARIRFAAPMLFCVAFYWNFFIGGISGVFLSDVPVDVTLHGSFFVMAHFHYTIMGGLVFAFFGAVYYWTPIMTGRQLNEKLAKAHFWMMFVFFNTTFFPLFLVGILGMPRRVFEYAPRLQDLNDIASISAYLLGSSFLIFIFNFVWNIFIVPKRAERNPWQSKGLEWMVPVPIPLYNFERIPVVLGDPYGYGESDAPPVADLEPAYLPLVTAATGPPGALAGAGAPSGPGAGGTGGSPGGNIGGPGGPPSVGPPGGSDAKGLEADR